MGQHPARREALTAGADRARLGANAILGVSLAVADKAAAREAADQAASHHAAGHHLDADVVSVPLMDDGRPEQSAPAADERSQPPDDGHSRSGQDDPGRE